MIQSYMFSEYLSWEELNFINFITNNVTNMSLMIKIIKSFSF